MIAGRKNEPHFIASDALHDIVIGMSDGLTVPFAIAAGLSGAHVAPHVVIIAGLSEIAAGSISMGLGGYLSGRTDLEHYEIERQREVQETKDIPDQEVKEVQTILRDNLGLQDTEAEPVVKALKRDREKWVDFMMRFELELEKPNPRIALRSGVTIGLSYAIAGFIPLGPYFFVSPVSRALYLSAGVTLLALAIFGYVRGRLLGVNAWRSAAQTLLIGGVAAGAAFGLARLIG
jgi:VIT1/CCC1 family predicted Fe2+/Mn2+ transporter